MDPDPHDPLSYLDCKLKHSLTVRKGFHQMWGRSLNTQDY